MRMPRRRNKATGGHHPCSACCSRKLVTTPGTTSHRRPCTAARIVPVRASVAAFAWSVRSMSLSCSTSSNRPVSSARPPSEPSACCAKCRMRSTRSRSRWDWTEVAVWARTRSAESVANRSMTSVSLMGSLLNAPDPYPSGSAGRARRRRLGLPGERPSRSPGGTILGTETVMPEAPGALRNHGILPTWTILTSVGRSLGGDLTAISFPRIREGKAQIRITGSRWPTSGPSWRGSERRWRSLRAVSVPLRFSTTSPERRCSASDCSS